MRRRISSAFSDAVRGGHRSWRLDGIGGEEKQLGGVGGLAIPTNFWQELFELMLEIGDEQALLTQGLGLLAK